MILACPRSSGGRRAWALWIVGFAAAARASEGPPPVLNPKTYLSPSGEYRLHVDPSTMYGQGKATYRLERGGQVVWEGERPFTLWDGGVTDDGLVAGYGYSHGWRGFPTEACRKELSRADWDGDFRVVILDGKGKPRLDAAEKRESSRFMHTAPNPLAEGMFVDGENDRLVVRVADPDLNRRTATWRVYRLSDGKRLADLRPRDHLTGIPRFCDDVAVRPVRGTPLALVHWWLFDQPPGGKFTLLGADGRPVWTLDLPGDYAVAGDQQAEFRLRDTVWQHGAILSCDQPRRFSLWHVAEKQRVSYEVRPRAGAPTAWDVVETGRTAFNLPTKEPPQLDTRPLEHLGTIRLGQPATTQPAIRDVRQFGFDAAGRIGFVRHDADGAATFVLVTAEGRVAAEITVANAPDGRQRDWQCAWLRDDRWVVIGIGWGVEPAHRSLRVEAEAGTFTEMPSFACPARVERLVSDRQGGFVVLVKGEFDQDGVIAFDGEGQRRWRAPRKHSGPDILMSPEDVALTTDGSVAVVCSFNKVVQLFDGRGKHLRRIELKNALSREPVYPSEVGADRDGGLIVGDWQGTPPAWRITGRGRLVSSLDPKFADGRTFPLHFGIAAAPDGRLWTTDGSSLLRLTDKGVVDRILGEAPSPDNLGQVAGMTVDAQGRSYLVSDRTCAIHVFDAAGVRVRVCEPLPGDFSSNIGGAEISVAGDGRFVLSANLFNDHGFLRFDRDGRRLGFVSEAEAGPRGAWLFKPRGPERWSIGHDAVYLVGADGKVLRTIERRPDNNWLERVQTAAVAPDGGLAVTAYDSRAIESRPVLCAYTPSGEPVTTIALPADGYVLRLAFNGRVVVYRQDKSWFVADVASGAVRRLAVDLPENPASLWQCFFVAGGDELWLCEPNSRIVERYPAPAGN